MTGLINLQYTDFLNRLKGGEKIECPCCGRHSQMYRRTIHHTIAEKLIDLYKMGGEFDYVHTSRLVRRTESGIGDFSKAKYWKLIQEAETTDERKRTSGLWKLTDKGVGFVMDVLTIPRTVLIFDDRVFGFSEDHVGIRDCIASGGFNYSELMKG